MHYKTMIHELLLQRPQMCAELRKNRQLMPTLERYARELKTSHEAWQEMLRQMRPNSDPGQIAGEALELALKEIEERLPDDSPDQATGRQVLDAAMLFLRHHSSRG
jgi:hypothetical protein